jgi:hypothetical protein
MVRNALKAGSGRLHVCVVNRRIGRNFSSSTGHERSIADALGPYNGSVSKDAKSLLALTLACAFAAALFGFGTTIFSFQSAYEEQGREQLLFFTREVVYVALAIVLVMKGGWWGVVAAISMTVGATAIEWLLFPAAYAWAGINDPAGYAERFAGMERPSYTSWATLDIIGVGIASAFAQGLRLMAHVNPRGRRDE